MNLTDEINPNKNFIRAASRLLADMSECQSHFNGEGQDVFAMAFLQIYHLANDFISVNAVTALDIGCGHPNQKSNTFVFEDLSYGECLCFDKTDYAKDFKNDRTRKFFRRDVTNPNFWNTTLLNQDWLEKNRIAFIKQYNKIFIPYLSLDIDEAGLTFLQQIPFDKVSFGCITFEHDYYQRGDALKMPAMEILYNNGYAIALDNAMINGLAWEDWYVRADLLERYRFPVAWNIDRNDYLKMIIKNWLKGTI